MKLLSEYSKNELLNFLASEEAKYAVSLSCPRTLNMARGKPSPEQLNLSNDVFDLKLSECGYFNEAGMDCRNYGSLAGIPECRKLFGELIGMPYDNVIACGSSSLNLMFDYVSQCISHGVGGHKPWIFNKKRKFIAVVPGYDRHFAIADYFGIELVNCPMTPEGPDMDCVEEIIKNPDVKGMFCVPKYSNPDGVTYSASTVERLAAMKPAAEDFRVIWDMAYIVHDIFGEGDTLANVFEFAEQYGNEDNFIAFASTSKITYAGAGVAAIAASGKNIKEIMSRLSVQIISYDKINQLRHSHFFKNTEDVKTQMKKQAEILAPKFELVERILDQKLGGLGIAKWTTPNGGYFISLDILEGSAKEVWQMCNDGGLVLTKCGATFPHRIDPNDSNLRIAPSYPGIEELEQATRFLCNCVRISAAKKLLKNLK